MSEDNKKAIPEYLKLGRGGRYECSKCGATIGKMFADLGCECDGKGDTAEWKKFDEARDNLAAIAFKVNDLSEDYKRRLVEAVQEEFGL